MTMTTPVIIITTAMRTMIRCLLTTDVVLAGITDDTCAWRLMSGPMDLGERDAMSIRSMAGAPYGWAAAHVRCHTEN